MMPGMIMIWYGSVATIPSGWALCDGTNGTPDLGGRFVFGARADPSWPTVGTTGGDLTHTHDFTGDGHAHELNSGDQIINSSPAGDFSRITSNVPADGTTDAGDTLPRFHTLCYIMKLP